MVGTYGFKHMIHPITNKYEIKLDLVISNFKGHYCNACKGNENCSRLK